MRKKYKTEIERESEIELNKTSENKFLKSVVLSKLNN